MTRVVNGSHSFTCTWTEWTIPALASQPKLVLIYWLRMDERLSRSRQPERWVNSWPRTATQCLSQLLTGQRHSCLTGQTVWVAWQLVGRELTMSDQLRYHATYMMHCYISNERDKLWFFSVLSFSRPWYEGWPHHGRTFSIYLCPLSFWLTLPRGVLSTSWCCPSRPCVVFLACMHLTLFLALSLSPGNSLVSRIKFL